MTDYEKLREILGKLNDKNPFVISVEPVGESRPLKHWSTDTKHYKRIDLRINGLLFDEEGNLIDYWAEYD